jgi:hypothetical protein
MSQQINKNHVRYDGGGTVIKIHKAKFLKLIETDLTMEEIAEKLGVTFHQVAYARMRLGGLRKRQTGPKYLDRKKDYILKRLSEGVAKKELARELQCSTAGILLATKRWKQADQ